MSSPQSRRPALEVRERPACMCAHGAICSSFAPGHALHLIQSRLAAATPSDWVDAVVEEVDADSGEISLRAVADGARITVWSAQTFGAAAGDPVALHGRYHVLSAGGRRANVARLTETAGA